MIWPFLTRWPFLTIGFWFRQVRSLRPTNLRRTYSSALSIRMRMASTYVTTPPRSARTTMPLFCATGFSMPVRDDRRVGPQQRHGLPLHVRTHQRAVGVVVLEERDQRRRDRDRLPRADVDVLDFLARRRSRGRPARGPGPCPSCRWPSFSTASGGARTRLHLLVGAEVLVLAVDLAVLHHAVRRDEEAVLVDVGVDRQRRDQADVGAFRRLDRADAAVVRDVHVADFEARALAVQTAGPEGRQAALVRELRRAGWSGRRPATARRGRRRSRSSC